MTCFINMRIWSWLNGETISSITIQSQHMKLRYWPSTIHVHVLGITPNSTLYLAIISRHLSVCFIVKLKPYVYQFNSEIYCCFFHSKVNFKGLLHKNLFRLSFLVVTSFVSPFLIYSWVWLLFLKMKMLIPLLKLQDMYEPLWYVKAAGYVWAS